MPAASFVRAYVESVEESVDRFADDASEILTAIADRAITPEETARIQMIISQFQAQLDSHYTGAQVIADAVDLIGATAGAGAVSNYVARRTREKHADYLRLVEPATPVKHANVIPFRQRTPGSPSAA